MFLFGVNFTLYYMIQRNIKPVLRDEELRFYCGVVVTAIVLITLNITGTVYQSIGESIRYASFQVSSIITTTGFGTADFNLWPTFSQIILVLLMLIGACAGSTGGGLKCSNHLPSNHQAGDCKIHHPRAIQTVKINGHKVDEETHPV